MLNDKGLQDRIRDRVAVMPDGCWIWLNYCDKDGYGKIKVHQRDTSAHRLSYKVFRGPIPDGMVIDHKFCSEPSCCNPQHLEVVTPTENTLRSETHWAAKNSRKTHCKRGHLFSDENTYSYRTARHCKQCRSDRQTLKGPEEYQRRKAKQRGGR